MDEGLHLEWCPICRCFQRHIGGRCSACEVKQALEKKRTERKEEKK